MTDDCKLYLMLDEEHYYGQFASGRDPAHAVEAHHSEMDAWCSPARDPDFYEEFCVWMYEIPNQLEESVEAEFDELAGGQYAEAIARLTKAHPEIKPVRVNVVYTTEEGAQASLLPELPDLLGGVGKG